MKKNLSRSLIAIFLYSSLIQAMEMHDEKLLMPSLRQTMQFKMPMAACYTKKGQKVIIGSAAGEFDIFNADDLSAPTSVTIKDAALHIDTSPINSEHIAIVNAHRKPVSIWDIEKQRCINTLTESNRLEKARSVQYYNNSNRLLVANDKWVELWDANSSKKVARYTASAGQTLFAQWNPQEHNEFAMCSENNNIVTIWDLRKSEEPVHNFDAKIPVVQVHYNSDGSKLMCPAPGQYAVFNAKNAALISYCSNLGQTVDKDKPLAISKGKDPIIINAVRCIPGSNRHCIASTNDAQVIIADLDDARKSLHFSAHMQADEMYALAIDPAGNTLITGLTMNDSVKVWDSSALKEKVETQTKAVAPGYACNVS